MIATAWNEVYYTPVGPTKKRRTGGRRMSEKTTLRVLSVVTATPQVAKDIAAKVGIADCSVRPHLYILRDRGLVAAEVGVGKPTKWSIK